MKLSSLHVNSFRGATKPIILNFSKDKNITLIYAENGNGKSSISDALICLCSDSVGSLDDKSGKDISFLKSLGSSSEDLSIKLVTDIETYSATMSATNKIIKNPTIGLPKLNALRRSQITTFTEDTASKRYEVLSSFIDVSNITKSETELKKLIATLDKENIKNSGGLTSAKETLNQIWDKEGQPLSNLESWINFELSKDLLKLTNEINENGNTLISWNSLNSIDSYIKNEKIKYDLAKTNYDNAKSNLEKHINENSNSDNKLLLILNETKKFLSTQETIAKCPVCEKDNSKEVLYYAVSERINKLNELNNLTKSESETKTNFNDYGSILQSQIESFNRNLISFKKIAEELKLFKFSTFLSNISEDKETKDNYAEFKINFNSLQLEIDKLRTNNNVLIKSQGQYNAIKSNKDSIDNLTKNSENSTNLLAKANASLKIIESSRKEFIDLQLSDISKEVEEMYQLIHPNEGLGNVRLFLNHNFQGSLNLTANFLTAVDIPPSSVYSESHLDTLGICIFLALAKKESNKDMILVLDDVVMSVDEKHLDRIIELIHNEAKYFAHIFISTHYRPWRERYRNNRAPNSSIQFIELRGWTKERGITIAKPMLVLDEIKFLILPENFHRENLAGTTGRFLEALLDFLTFNFQSKLKRKPGNDFSLSELLDALSKDLLKLLKIQKMHLNKDNCYDKIRHNDEIYLKDTIDKIKLLKTVRNQVGAHFTFDGQLVSDYDVEELALLTIELGELLICPRDGNLPDRKNSGSYWETKSGSIRLFPLVEP